MNILLAEDETFTRRGLEVMLREWGHQVTAVADGEAAWNAYALEHPALVILDWQMPVLDGLAVCRRVRASEPQRETFVLLVTAREAPEAIAEALAAGADDYMTKPVTPGHLRARLTIARLGIEQGAARRNAEAALARARWLAGIGETALALQHEINNPLAALMAHATVVAMEELAPVERREHLAEVLAQARRIAEVVRRLSVLEDPTTVEYQAGARMLDLSGRGPASDS